MELKNISGSDIFLSELGKTWVNNELLSIHDYDFLKVSILDSLILNNSIALTHSDVVYNSNIIKSVLDGSISLAISVPQQTENINNSRNTYHGRNWEYNNIPYTINSTDLTTFLFKTNMQYFIPFVAEKDTVIEFCSILVTTSVKADIRFTVYDTDYATMKPKDNLAISSNWSIRTTSSGLKEFWFTDPIALLAGKLYWLSVHSAGATTVRGLSATSVSPILGISRNSNVFTTYLQQSIATSDVSLPEVVYDSLNKGTGNIPAICIG